MCSGGSRAERAGGGHRFGWVCLQEVGVAAAAFGVAGPLSQASCVTDGDGSR